MPAVLTVQPGFVRAPAAAASPDSESAPSLVLAGNRPAEEVAFDRALVGFFIEAADLLGVPKSVAAIYGICFASPQPLGFSEIQARLDISAGSISQGLRVLREIGALKVAESPLRREPNPEQAARVEGLTLNSRGARPREYFEPDMELRKVIAHFIENRLQKQLSSGRTRLQAIAKAVPPPGPKGASKILKARLHALQTWHSKARAVMPIIRTFLKLT